MNDIVLDTNVLLHTNNKNNEYYESANICLNLILERDLSLCFDDVFNPVESKNTSVIGSEYFGKIQNGTFAYVFLMDRLIKGKYVQVIKKNYNKAKIELNKIIKNRHDISFVITAFGSQGKLLISNDYTDFKQNTRKYISKKFQVSILDSDEYSTS